MSVESGAFFLIAKPISRTHLFAYHSILVTRPTHVKLGFSDILFRTVARCYFLSFGSVIFRCLQTAVQKSRTDDSINFPTYISDHEVSRAVLTGLSILKDPHRGAIHDGKCNIRRSCLSRHLTSNRTGNVDNATIAVVSVTFRLQAV